jgi:metallo-beta-lactamase class B
MHSARATARSRCVAVALAAAALGACAGQAGVPYAMRSWNRDLDPYRVIGNIYYVGSNEMAEFLITTPAGHILLDSGFEASVPRLRDNVQKLGFRFEDIKILLATHAHIDHVQGHALVRQLTGAKVVASAADAVFLAAGGKGETVFDGVYSWTPCPVDRVIADGASVALGGTTLTAHVTPGHTRGATTWTMRMVDGGRPLDVVFFPSANVNPGVRLIGNQRYPEIAADFERSFATWKSLPCDVFLGAHGQFYGMRDKLRQMGGAAGANPFIDPQGYRRFLVEAEGRFRAQLASER